MNPHPHTFLVSSTRIEGQDKIVIDVVFYCLLSDKAVAAHIFMHVWHIPV